MESLGKKVGYLRGMLEGIGEEEQNTLNGKLMQGIVELLGALSDRADAVDEMLAELNDYVESIDDDLSELEGSGDGQDFDEESFDDDEEDLDEDYTEDQLHLLRTEETDDIALAGGLCPECGGLFFVEGSEEEKYVCPHCGKTVSVTPLTSENAPIGKPAREE